MLWFIFGCSGVVKKVRYKNVEKAVQFFLRDVCYNRSQKKLCSLRVSTLMYLRFPPMMYLQQQKNSDKRGEKEIEREEEELPDDLMN